MSAVQSFIDTVWAGLGVGLIHGTVLALVTLVLTRTVFRRARPAFVSALWTIVLIKFLMPVGPTVPVSLSGALDHLFGNGASAEALISASENAGRSIGASTQVAAQSAFWSWVSLAVFGAYLIVVAYLIAGRIRAQRAHRRLAESLPNVVEPELHAVAARAATVLGLTRVPRLRVSADVAAPQLVGVVRPIVVVPARLPEDADRPSTLEAMLLHEFAHLRRRDTWLRVLQLAAAVLFFFWPVVRWVNRRIDEHREMACDQWALTHGRMTPTRYARTLVLLARRASPASERTTVFGSALLGSLFLGMALVRGRRQLTARVDALLAGPSRPRLGLATGAALALFAVLSLGTTGARRAPVLVEAGECTVEPGLLEYIMSTYPEADIDGDGALSRDEVCAQKRRLQEIGALDSETSQVEPASYDPVLASLDADRLDCQACGCSNIEPAGDLASQPAFNHSIDKKVCTTD